MIFENESKIVVLSHWMEIIGLLHSLNDREDVLLAEIGTEKVALPANLREVLCPQIGHRIAILRTDIPGKEHLVRIVTEKKYPAFDQIREASLTEPKAQREKASA